MHFSAVAFACALVLPVTASAEQIDLKTGGWEIVSVMPNGEIGPTQKQCLSKEDLRSMRMFLPPESEADCSMQGLNQTKTTLEIQELCTGAHPSTLIIKIKADHSKKFVATLIASAYGTTQTAQMSARWIQDSCEGFTD